MIRIHDALAARREQLKNGQDKGFTLIELLVVVIIIGILAAIAIPIYIGIQNGAKESAVKSDLTNWKTAYVAAYTQFQSDAAANPGTGDLPDVATNVGASTTTWAALGATESGDYANAPAVAPSITVSATDPWTDFCITATAVTGKAFYVNEESGVSETSC